LEGTSAENVEDEDRYRGLNKFLRKIKYAAQYQLNNKQEGLLFTRGDFLVGTYINMVNA